MIRRVTRRAGDGERGIIQPGRTRVNTEGYLSHASGIFILAQSEVVSGKELALWGCASVIAIFIIWRTGAFRPASVIGPERHGRVMTRPLAILMVAAFIVSLAIAQVFFTFRNVNLQDAGESARDLKFLTPRDWAFLSVVPGLAGITLIVIGHLAGKTGAVKELGFAGSQFLRGFLGGILGLIVVLPIMNWWILLLQWSYDVIHLQHPTEHELLHELSQAGDLGTKLAIVIGATVIAPVFEEMIFRAHLQTLLVRLFTLTWKNLPPVLPVAGVPDPVLQSTVSPYQSEPAARPPPALLWSAVILTSLIFAAIHPAWMAPLIFVLALCLGYVYERTGNLWVPILIHAAFNTASTVVFLNTL